MSSSNNSNNPKQPGRSLSSTASSSSSSVGRKSSIVPNLKEMLGGEDGGGDKKEQKYNIPQDEGKLPAAITKQNKLTKEQRRQQQQEEEMLRIKEREREARSSSGVVAQEAISASRTSSIVPNLASLMMQQESGGNYSNASASDEPPATFSPNKKSSTTMNADTTDPQPRQQPTRKTSSIRQTAVVVPNLKDVLKEEQQPIQPSLEATAVFSSRNSTVVPNLARVLLAKEEQSMVVPASPPQKSPQKTGTKKKAARSQEEKDRLAKQQAQQGRSSAVVPNLAEALSNETPMIPTSPTKSPQKASKNVSKKKPPPVLTQEERDRLAKQQAMHGPGSGASTSPPLQPPLSSNTSSHAESIHARYQAVGMVFGEDGGMSTDFFVPENQEELMQQSSSHAAAHANNHLSANSFQSFHSGDSVDDILEEDADLHVPESQEAVRERFRAATLALGGDVSEMDEEQQLKHREKEEREFLAASVSVAGSATRSVASTTSSKAHGLDQSDKDAKAKAKAGSVTYESSHSGMDGSSKSISGSRRARRIDSKLRKDSGLSQNSDVVAGSTEMPTAAVASGDSAASGSTARRAGQPVAPGALAVSQGTAERLAKARVTEQPDMLEAGEAVMPLSLATTATSTISTSLAHQPLTEPLPPPPPVETVEEPTAVAEAAPVSTSDLVEEGGGGDPVYTVSGREATGINEEKETEPSFWGKWWKWIVAAVVVIGVAAGVGGGVAASGGGSSGGAEPSPAPVPTDAPTAAPVFVESPRFQDIQEALVDVGIATSDDLEDSTSSQYQALAWIANEDTTYSDLDDIDTLTARYIQAVFYYNLDGPSWNDEWSDWLDPNADECDWMGVTCEGTNDIVKIEFPPEDANEGDESMVGMAGLIPTEMRALPELRTLRLLNNDIGGLEGPIPQLESLALGFNIIQQSFLENIFSMTNLQSLDISWNDLTGTITDQFQQLTNLRRLELQRNRFEGEFARLYKGLTGLAWLDIGENKFSGSIPLTISEVRNLTFLGAQGNDLTGTFPDTIWDLPNLGVLDLSNQEDLSGTISPAVGNVKKLELLYLNDNRFAASIPTEIGLVSELRLLRLNNNFFEGRIPAELSNRGRLAELELYSNLLTGSLPPELGVLQNMKFLEVQQNFLTGSLPAEYSNLRSLETLYVQLNPDMTGALPDGMCELPRLQSIRVGGTDISCGECDKCNDT